MPRSAIHLLAAFVFGLAVGVGILVYQANRTARWHTQGQVLTVWRHPRSDEQPPRDRILDRRAQRTADFYWETNNAGEWRWVHVGRRRLVASGPAWECQWRPMTEAEQKRFGLAPPGLPCELWRWETNSDFEFRLVRYVRSSSDGSPH
ncbi:MAG: hypothetical protein JNG90_05315 [Planctomycetaceae bacterium]|nr:hypothetical protein [Planctomycetaceae bacterium]